MSDFDGQVVLVTGAGKGLGRAIALAFAARGAVIAANDLTPVNLDETLRLIRAVDGKAKDYLFDVAKKMPVQAMIEEIVQDWGHIDILINYASVSPKAELLELDEWDWLRTLDVNLSGAFYTIQSVGRIMREQNRGAIVNIASSLGLTGTLPGQVAYIASSVGLIGLTRAAAEELAPYNIHVNAICQDDPGHKQEDTPQQKFILPPGYSEPPVGVVNLALFLCSQSAPEITGQVFQANGSLVLPW